MRSSSRLATASSAAVISSTSTSIDSSDPVPPDASPAALRCGSKRASNNATSSRAQCWEGNADPEPDDR